MRSQIPFIVLVVLGLILLAFGLSLDGAFLGLRLGPTAPAPSVAGVPSGAPPPYNPPKPEDAPQDIRDAVLLGQSILTDTQKMLPTYVSDQVTCSNCHFEAGLTQGGQNGGISLVGVAATYPKYRDRQKYAVDLVARLND